jgi:hypothetical protein
MPRDPTRPAPTPPPPAHAGHPHHLHNPLDAPLAGHQRSESLLTWLIIAHVIGACVLAYRFWVRGGSEEGEGGAPGPRRGAARRGGLAGRPTVSAAYSFADLTDAGGGGGPTTVVVDRGGGGSAEMVGMGARRMSRGALRRPG